MDLKNKNVIFVGGFGGIGFASCKILLAEGVANLLVIDARLNDDRLQQLRDINRESKVDFIQLNLTDGRKKIDLAFAEAFKRLGRFDIVINGSGILNEELVEETLRINLEGLIFSTFAALPYMDKTKNPNADGGLIVNIASLVALDSYSAYAVYTATKYGVYGFTRALSDPFYYNRTNVGFITICPGLTETPMVTDSRAHPKTTFPEQPPMPKSLCDNQSAEDCAMNMVEAIKTAKNGSVWILRDGKLSEHIVMPME